MTNADQLNADQRRLLQEYEALLTGRWITDLANTSAFIFAELKNINWAGFYLVEQGQLVLGPFQGKPACTEIAIGKGVCGTAVSTKQVQLVHDVHEFPGHIACDPNSRSELVIPMLNTAGKVLGVLDLDSPALSRFQKSDAEFMQQLVKILLQKTTSIPTGSDL